MSVLVYGRERLAVKKYSAFLSRKTNDPAQKIVGMSIHQGEGGIHRFTFNWIMGSDQSIILIFHQMYSQKHVFGS
jgi:hypothetical protein